MVRVTHLCIALGLGLCSVAAVAQSTPDAAPAAKPAKVKKVCRSDVPSGTKIPVSTCHTAAEWAQIDQAQREAVAANRNLAPTSNGK